MVDPLFYNSYILFSDKNIKKIKNTKISIAGIGGVGSITLEMLCRLGIENYKIADFDTYCENNMNRQIFATKDTIGKNKAVVAKERILSINKNANVIVFDKGVTVDNVYDFCKNSDIILAINDTESIKVLLHKVAKEMQIPVIMGSRASIDGSSRWCVKAKLWDYKSNPSLETFGSTNHPEFDKYSIKEITQEIADKYDKKIKKKKIDTFKKLTHDETNNLFKTISMEELYKKIEKNPDSYNRHVCSVVANTAGCFAATLALNYIIGNKKEELIIDLL